MYFNYDGKPMCFACDRWQKVEENIRAIALTIEALRGIARWGTGDMLEAAFRGFQALPAPRAIRHWRGVLGISSGAPTRQEIDLAYKRLRSANHPDKGGDPARFHEIAEAYRQACTEID